MKLFLLFVFFISFQVYLIDGKGSVHECVKATQALATTGDGTDSTSCAGCDPALDSCYTTCQGYIKNVYFDCDGVCLPEGYYFDPQEELTGCFSANQFKFKIKVERCGCDAALPTVMISWMSFLIVIVATMYWSFR
mmetsp:Transcript_29725/g.32355  ORF Transcript_29725/g.32355 Transcript_29725/m.32355 type:complete len:136 (+) Transcript_29725:16-423(+)|eukprot:gene7527-8123_t